MPLVRPKLCLHGKTHALHANPQKMHIREDSQGLLPQFTGSQDSRTRCARRVFAQLYGVLHRNNTLTAPTVWICLLAPLSLLLHDSPASGSGSTCRKMQQKSISASGDWFLFGDGQCTSWSYWSLGTGMGACVVCVLYPNRLLNDHTIRQETQQHQVVANCPTPRYWLVLAT